ADGKFENDARRAVPLLLWRVRRQPLAGKLEQHGQRARTSSILAARLAAARRRVRADRRARRSRARSESRTTDSRARQPYGTRKNGFELETAAKFLAERIDRLNGRRASAR